MVDAVVIEGIGSGLTQWASEATSTEILNTLQKMQKLSEQQVAALKKGGGLGPSQKAVDDLTQSMDDLENQSDRNSNALQESTKQTKSFGDAVASTAKQLISWGIGATITGLGVLTGGIAKQLSMVVDLNAAGMDLISTQSGVVSGMGTFAWAAREANLEFSELVELQKEYGNTLNIYGIQRFAKSSKEFTERMRHLGATSSESAEFLAEYIDMQRTQAYTNSQDLARQTRQAEALFQNFDAMSHTLSLSKKQMLDNIRSSIEGSIQTKFYLQSVPEEIRGAFTEFGAMMGGPETETLRNKIFDAISDPFLARTDLFQAFASSAPGATDALKAMQDTIKSSKKMSEEQSLALFDTLANANESMLMTMGMDANETKQLVMESKIAAQNLRESIKWQKALDEDKEKILKDQLKGAAGLTDAWKMVTTVFERTIGELFKNGKFVESISKFAFALDRNIKTIIPKILDFAASLADKLPTIIDMLSKWLDDITSVAEAVTDPGKAISDFFSGGFVDVISSGLKAIWDNPLITAAIVGGLALLFKGLPAMGGAVGGAAGGAAGGLLGGLGKGAGMAIQGIGAGLAALGSQAPMILLGATAIGGAIALIGAGIAGATWLTGSALSTFTSSLKEFETLDSTKLSALGGAIADIGAGLSLFAGGTALQSASGIGDSIAGIFGMDTSFTDKFKEFEEMASTSSYSSENSVFVKMATDVDLLATAITNLNNVGAIQVGPGNNVTIGEKKIVETTIESPSLNVPTSKGDNTTVTSPEPARPEKYSEINTKTEIDLLKKQLKVLTNIAENIAIQVQYSRQERLSDESQIDPFQ